MIYGAYIHLPHTSIAVYYNVPFSDTLSSAICSSSAGHGYVAQTITFLLEGSESHRSLLSTADKQGFHTGYRCNNGTWLSSAQANGTLLGVYGGMTMSKKSFHSS